jgi:hypothetical protein
VLTLAAIILLLAIAALVLSWPLVLQQLEPYRVAAPDAAIATEPARSEAARLLEAMTELEQARLAGKLTDDDYAGQRERLEREYVRVTEAGA